MAKHWFVIQKKGTAPETYIANNNKQALSMRKELVKQRDVVLVSPVKPITNTALPMQFKAIIKRGVDHGQ